MIQFTIMDQAPRAVTWEAPEHNHTEKGGDWFFAFTLIFIAIVLAAVLLGNNLFALLMAVAGLTLAIAVSRRPAHVPYAVTVRGVRINDEIFPYATLQAYSIDEEDPRGPHLLILSQRKFMPLLIIPLPPDHVDDIEDILRDRLPEEHLEEPLFLKVLEIFGF
jgi:hypothetical protein